jgi:hypothetical protein
VEVPPKAEARKGIQPVVELKLNGGARAEVAVGQPVTFSATIEAPPNTGKVVAVEWNFEGAGGYLPAEPGDIKPTVSVKARMPIRSPALTFLCCVPPHNGRAIRRLRLAASRNSAGRGLSSNR